MEPGEHAAHLARNLRVANAKIVGAAEKYSDEPTGENYSRLTEFLGESEAIRMELCGVIEAIDFETTAARAAAAESRVELAAHGIVYA